MLRKRTCPINVVMYVCFRVIVPEQVDMVRRHSMNLVAFLGMLLKNTNLINNKPNVDISKTEVTKENRNVALYNTRKNLNLHDTRQIYFNVLMPLLILIEYFQSQQTENVKM